MIGQNAQMEFAQQVTFLPVADLSRSVQFYGTTLGLEEVLDQGDCRIYRVAGEAFIGVCARQAAAPRDGVMVTLVSDDVDGWHRRLIEAGTRCDAPPTHNEKYQLYHAFYRDPDGHILEVQQFLDPAWPAPGA